MRAFHVIGIDLQLGLGRDTRRLAQQDVAVLLLRIGALGVGRHIDQPAELPYGRTARDTFYIRVAAAVGHVVVRPQPDDAMLLPGGEELLPQMDELSRAFQAAHLPVNMASVSLFRVSAAKGFEVFIENRNLVLCIAAEDWDANLRRLSLVLSDLARRGELKTAREVWAADGNVWVVEPENV